MVSMDTGDEVMDQGMEQQQQQQQEEEGVYHTEPNTTLFYGQRDRGKGTLLITEHHVVWKGAQSSSDVLTLQYPSISLHAISRDTSSFPHECLYVLLEAPVEAPPMRDEAAAVGEHEDESDEDRDPEAEVCEVRFVPDNSDNIKAMYDALAECQELNPDPDDVDSDDVGGDEEPDFEALLQGGAFYTADNMPDEIELSAEGQAVLQRLNINATQGGGGANGNGCHGNGNGCHGNGNGGNDQFEDADDGMEES